MQLIPLKPLSHTWLKASVVGSIWASVEIILGSFLHNLKIPMSGMFLSFIGVWILISFLQVWKENGLIWRAGLICAMMKSISPSAFIFGPMIGIFTESILIELFIFIFGKNIIGYLIGGAFAVLSTILQKLASLLILYGFDLVKILSDLYKFAVKQIDLEQLSPSFLIILIVLIYIVAGMTGAVAGYITGLKYLRSGDKTDNSGEVTLSTKRQLSDQSSGESYSLIFFLVNLISVVTILFLMNSRFITAAVTAAVIYLIFCILKYKNSLKRLKKISFWLGFVVIAFASSFLWNGFSHGVFFSMDGLIVGLKMNARAIIIVIGFASISVELRNPVIKSVLYHRGFANLYQSLNLAFSALPYFISNISTKSKGTKVLSGKTLNSILGQAETLFYKFEKEHTLKATVVIITGEIQQGKTTFTQKIISELISRRIKMAGFLSIGIDEHGIRNGFNLCDIESGKLIELCSDKKEENRLKLGRFYFNQKALEFGNEILKSDNVADKQLIVIDEIGPLEVRGQGWCRAIDELTDNFTIPHLWVVRKSLVQKISRKWNIGDAWVFDIADSSLKDVVEKLAELININISD